MWVRRPPLQLGSLLTAKMLGSELKNVGSIPTFPTADINRPSHESKRSRETVGNFQQECVSHLGL